MKQTSSLWLYSYWDSVRKDRPAPKRYEIDPGRIGPLLPDTFILECRKDGSFRFRLAGTQMCDIHGRELRNADFRALWSDAADRQVVTEILHSVSRDFGVGILELDGYARSGRQGSFEIILLPLIHSGEGADRILGCMTLVGPGTWRDGDPLVSYHLRETSLFWPDKTPLFATDSQRLVSVQGGASRPMSPPSTQTKSTARHRPQLRLVKGGKSDG